MTERKVLIVNKADPMPGYLTPDTFINITEGLLGPARYDDLADWDSYCFDQARQIEEALIAALPGGVYDRLLGHMLARKASHFRVAHLTTT